MDVMNCSRKRSPSLGSTVQSKPACCPLCDSREIIKRGVRKNSLRHLQVYFCKECSRYFVPLQGLRGVKYPPRLIARALCLHNLGDSQARAARTLWSEHHVAVPHRTISHWITAYRHITTFHRFRKGAMREFGRKMLKEHVLDHQQVYQYKLHLPKLALTQTSLRSDVAAKVARYLESVFEGFPDHLFQQDAVATLDGRGVQMPEAASSAATAMRCSAGRFEMLPLVPTEKQNLANDLAALGLLLARKNRDRHPSIQTFMLANDSSTVACEVPVYLTAEEIAYYKSRGFFLRLPESAQLVTGHIDVLQIRNGLIHLLDYKPNAREVQPTNQLVVYALALASRTRLPVKLFKCAWFDEKDYFEFYPLEAIHARRTESAA